MSSLVYLIVTGIKNSIKELMRKPGKLVLYLLVFASIIGLLILSLFTQSQNEMRLPLFWLQGIVFAFVTLFLVMAIQKGLTSGDAIFEMSDVNLLFVSPVNPRSILLYGLVRLMKVSFFAGFFILFQSNTLALFGVGFGGVLLLFLLFILCVIVQSILSLVIYSTTNGNPRRKRLVKILAVLCFVPLALVFALGFFQTGDMTAALTQAIQSPALSAIPLAGWTAASCCAFFAGDVLAGIGWLCLLLLAGAGMLIFVLFHHIDYYEDVLVATETAFERKRAAQEGDIQAATAASAKVKVTKTGIGGKGASAIFSKHLRETFRQNRFGFFGLSTVIIFASVLGAALVLRDQMDVVTILQILMWVQIFLIGTGRGLKELYSHYLYMIPEPAIKKLVWNNAETVFKTFIESILFLLVPGIVLGQNFLVSVEAMLVYTLFSLFLLGINYLSMRFIQTSVSQGILLTVYFVAVIILILPGLIPALIVGFSIGGTIGTIGGLAILAVWELISSLAFFALSRNVLHTCDMPTMKMN